MWAVTAYAMDLRGRSDTRDSTWSVSNIGFFGRVAGEHGPRIPRFGALAAREMMTDFPVGQRCGLGYGLPFHRPKTFRRQVGAAKTSEYYFRQDVLVDSIRALHYYLPSAWSPEPHSNTAGQAGALSRGSNPISAIGLAARRNLLPTRRLLAENPNPSHLARWRRKWGNGGPLRR